MNQAETKLVGGLSLTLHNEFATLVPMAEVHRKALAEAGSDASIWTLQPFNIAEGFDAYFDWLLSEKAKGSWGPFAVLDSNGKVVGQTCYLDIHHEDYGLEIGGT